MNKLIWSDAKNRLNISKHGVNFEEAGTIFDDPLQITIDDPDHSSDERHFLTFGVSIKNRLLIVAHVFRDDKIRIISARKPTRRERGNYEEGVFDA